MLVLACLAVGIRSNPTDLPKDYLPNVVAPSERSNRSYNVFKSLGRRLKQIFGTGTKVARE